ncbi:hypothetical protein Q2295_15605 [Leptospira interrogans]|uniref:Uncharacterized protein n=1 Tax=Leptospira interrogans serovar Pomona TaxID=44276 RepID=A0AA41BII6_LEPIR|nr:hypothetical protein [Leptospira interrogans]EJO77694.1 hypothetical protein LEP1GSC045_1348 [Leptospira interrogans serovar Pomona str. Kennewicki LC82-25]EKN96475.1 hypothetical protein LEP1GSC014_0656 [Leptospira interrogans serovar Pomona str. Pomona]KYZ62302.1 hypothetical protein AWU66_10640 [Leptospira interrogans serovar Pomona]MBE8355049.1 hypothetical protein [Leptospira interrogans serovar Pomona]MBE8419550.1 hypothetical protein [Leptospira interrogans serovar Pomona]
MLGLLSAGAGAYTLFKDKPAPKDSDLGKSSSKTSGSETRTDSNLRSDRGKEIPVDPQSGKEQQPLSERESKPGKEDPQKHKEEFPGLRKKPKLNLKNKVDDIIRNNSKFANHRRPLINAEALVDKESYNGALEIYKRTKTRIPDEEIQNKIQENIDQIQDHLESDEDEVYRPDRYDGPPIPLGDLVRAIKDISESLGDTIAKGFSNPISIPLSPWDPGAIPGPPPTPEKFPPGPVSYQIVSPIPPEEHIPLPSPGTPTPSGGAGGSGGGAGGVGTPTPSGGAGSSGGGAGGVGTPTPSGGTGGSGGGAGGVGTPTPSGGTGGSGGGAGGVGTPTPSSGTGGSGGGAGGVGTPTPSSGTGGSGGGAGTYSQSYSEPNAMDLPDDTFFSEEWEKFKDLPLVDRRTGENRRSGTERRAGSKRKDRRQGEDRRKEDLFKLRDEYLKQKEEQKKREREEAGFEAQDSADFDWTEAPARDELPPFLAPVLPKIELIPIRLPDPQDKTIRPEEEETSQTPSSTSQSGEIRLEAPTTSETPEKIPTPLELPKIGLPDPEYQKTGETTPEIPHLAPASSDDSTVADETPEIEVLEGGLEPLGEDVEEDTGSGGDESTGGPKEEEPRMIHGILELKPPEVDDAPFLTLTYDFDKIPHAFKLSKNYSIMEYSYYKYKPMLVKAQEFARRKMLKNALNYYRVIKSQNIPPELRKMINRNIKDITEFMEKYLMAKGG